MRPRFLIFGFSLVSCVPDREMMVLRRDLMAL